MYLVSACLAGVNCRYNGGNSKNEVICELVRQGKAISICPELLGGLQTPRECCEIIVDEIGDKKVISKTGKDFNRQFIRGAEKTLIVAKTIGIKAAVLQSRSPSCGYGLIYDGTFSGNLTKGYGFTAELLAENGIKIYTENDFQGGIPEV